MVVIQMKQNDSDLIKIGGGLKTSSYSPLIEPTSWSVSTHNSKQNDEKSVTVTQVSQNQLKTIGIYDNEWEAVSKNVKEIYEKTSKFSLGNLLDGITIGLLIPFGEAIYHLLNSKDATEIKNNSESGMFYFILLCVVIIIYLIKKIKKPNYLSTYKDFDNDLKHTVNRIDEINKRLKIKKEE